MREAPTVSELMTTDLVVAHARDPVGQAMRVITFAGIRHLPVVDDKGTLIGLVSQRDLLIADEAEKVGDVMSRDVFTVAPETAAYEAALLLWEHKIGCVPVTRRDGKLVGLLTEADFVRLAYLLLGGRAVVDDLIGEDHEAGQ